MSSGDESIEVEMDAEVAGSGSKLSDDSGIEDSWNEDNSNTPSVLNSRAQQSEASTNGKTMPTVAEAAFSTFNPLTPPSDHELSSHRLTYGPSYRSLDVYPGISQDSTPTLIRCDVKDPDAEAGVCGIENLGNTCFMNAGLQCIFAVTSLQQLIINEKSLGPVTNPENSKAVIRMVDKFLEVFLKVVSGEYKQVYPVDFHNALTQVHAIFGDRKQHDCQEFVSFLLNGLHDALNRANPRKRIPRPHESREGSPRMSSLRLETSSESDNDDLEETGEECSKRMRIDNFDTEPDFGVECDEKLTPAQIAWRGYLEHNRSIIVETFQGQFKSMVTCEKCHHVSTTYEPFMHVSVPIPHAHEQQVVVNCRFQPNNSFEDSCLQTKRFVVTVSKNATVGNVKKELIKAMEEQCKIEEENMIMAEVSNSSLIRTLVPDMGLQFLKWNDEKQLYAIIGQKISPSDNISLHEKAVHCEDIENTLPKEGPTGWHTCGICLEDIFDDDLVVHNICGGVLCKGCLEATASYHSGQSFPCPVCNATVDEKFFNEMGRASKGGDVNRTVLVPLLMRCSTHSSEDTENEKLCLKDQFQTFGHPSVLLSPPKVRIRDIENEIWRMMPKDIGYDYELMLTDSQGISCSRCDTFSDCSGCKLNGEEEIKFKPGDHIALHFNEISEDSTSKLSLVMNDTSVSTLRDGDSVRLSECFQYFCESEVLTEENPWFCPTCRLNQIATKSISISKWPDVLIVHLKRFYFEGLLSAKITSPVEFAESNFNLDFVCSTEALSKDSYIYELVGFVSHTGSLTSGHYTAYCKHNSDWYLFNDEITCKVDVSSVDLEKVYMLFYQKLATCSTS